MDEGLPIGAGVRLRLAVQHPARAAGAVFVGATIGLGARSVAGPVTRGEDRLENTDGGATTSTIAARIPLGCA